jgi:hypothetical protein
MPVGDCCLVRRPLTPGISQRLQRKNRDEIYQIVEVHGDGVEAKAYTVCDLKGRRYDLGFSQLVAAEPLTPVDVLPLVPGEQQSSRILVKLRGVDKPGTVVNQFLDGRVIIHFDDGSDGCYDLCTTDYRWIT